jgi:hypothetical protein
MISCAKIKLDIKSEVLININNFFHRALNSMLSLIQQHICILSRTTPFAETDASDMQVKGHERSYSEGAAGTVTDGPSIKLEKKSSNQNQTSVKQIISQLMTSTTNAYVIQVNIFVSRFAMVLIVAQYIVSAGSLRAPHAAVPLGAARCCQHQ